MCSLYFRKLPTPVSFFENLITAVIADSKHILNASTDVYSISDASCLFHAHVIVMICTRWLLFAAGLLSLLPGELCSVRILLTENDISTSTAFVLGNYSIAPQERSVYLLNQCPGIKGYVGNILLTLSAAKGMSLGDYHTTAIDSTFCQALSDQLNHCGKGKKFNESEVYYHAALAIWPWNVLAVKNMGFHMELNHRVGEAMSLYSQVSCGFDSIFGVPSV